MNIGQITQGAAVQNRSIDTPSQGAKTKNQEQSQHSQDQHVMKKIKEDPAYTPTIQEEALIKAIETANKKVSGGPREFEFAIHERTKQIMVKVLDTETKEVIREIPPEKILDMIAGMWEAAGLFVDEKR